MIKRALTLFFVLIFLLEFEALGEEVFVRGTSLAPLVNPGQAAELLYGYYDNQPVEREDIIAYRYAGRDVSIIKIVKAIPGDKWRLKRDEQNNSYQIIVNGKPLKNSQNKLYQIPESKSKMLKLYAREYPQLGENTYLILGNQTSGSKDSTKFGLVDKSDILGKVIISQ